VIGKTIEEYLPLYSWDPSLSGSNFRRLSNFLGISCSCPSILRAPWALHRGITSMWTMFSPINCSMVIYGCSLSRFSSGSINKSSNLIKGTQTSFKVVSMRSSMELRKKSGSMLEHSTQVSFLLGSI
jgi:hypothetical protein